MREYETVFILHPKVDDAGIDREIESVKKTISDGKGELVGVHKWGRRKLAYPIQRAHEGFYVIARFQSDAAVLTELERRFRLNESVLRNLTVQSPGGEWPPDLRSRERRPPRGDRSDRSDRGGRDRRPPRGHGRDEAAGTESHKSEEKPSASPGAAAETAAKPKPEAPAESTEKSGGTSEA